MNLKKIRIDLQKSIYLHKILYQQESPYFQIVNQYYSKYSLRGTKKIQEISL